jgi:hypothetical protein
VILAKEKGGMSLTSRIGVIYTQKYKYDPIFQYFGNSL